MALTLTNPTEQHFTGPESWGRTRVVEKIISFDSSYDLAGETLTAAMFGLSSLRDVRVGPRLGYAFEWSPTSSSTGTLQARPTITELTEVCLKSAFTDGGGTSGFKDFAGTIPAGSIILGWRVNTTVAWTGDTSAVMIVGVSGDTDRFTADTAISSVFATGLDGSLALAADSLDGINAAVTPRVTVTSTADFTNTNAAASSTVSVIFIPPSLPAADLSTLTGVRAVAYGY